MATVLHPPMRLTSAQRKSTVTLYLAGPFDGAANTWRDKVIAAFDHPDVTIIDPRNPKWESLDVGSPGRRGAYDWQCAAAFDADVVVVWVPDGSHSPTALLILGYLGAKRSSAAKGSSVVVGGSGCEGLAQLFAQNQRLFPAGDDLREVIRLAELQVGAALTAKGLGGVK